MARNARPKTTDRPGKPALPDGPVHTLIIGSGGREHALGHALKRSPRCGKLYFAPGNGGTDALGQNVDLPATPVNTKHVDAINYFCRQRDITLIVVGPEDPLAAGLVDRLEQPGRFVFGPTADAARLEADKAYAKQVMKAASIPTADARTFTDFRAAANYVEARDEPVVVKAAGLAKGKGAIVCDTTDEAIAALRKCFEERAFGDAGNTVLVEEKMLGQELSVLALVDGQNIYVLDPCQDHKQAHEGDTGPNTGGMGAYCPTPLIDDELMTTIEREVLVPAVDYLRRDGTTYRGVLYAGLMLTAAGPKVIEFNCRFGDPECQPLVARLQGDLLEAMLLTCVGRLDEANLAFDERHAACVVVAAQGYPGDYPKGLPITGLDEAEAMQGVSLFHAGTKLEKGGRLVTAGGRVINVVATAESLTQAVENANEAASRIRFDGAWFRRDIGHRVAAVAGR
ncbi:MAG: phosphoribosylamine--glycine ligase [Planctomycetota bacterium]